MLSYELTRNLAGLTLIGDYTTFRALHRVVFDVNERSPIVAEKHKDGPFIDLAYEVRKAYELKREIIAAPKGYEEMGVRYGFKMPWPVILFQHRTLRVSLGYFDHGPEHQAMTYSLEAVLLDAVREAFKGRADAVLARWQQLDPAAKSAFDKFYSRGALFCSWSRSERNRLLPSLLQSFHPHYDEAASALQRNGEFISPGEFIKWEGLEWPEINW